MAKTNARGDVTVTLADGRKITLSLTMGAMDRIEQYFDCGFEDAIEKLESTGPGQMGRVARFISALTFGQPVDLDVQAALMLDPLADLPVLAEAVNAIMARTAELADGDDTDAGAPGE